MIAMRIIGTAPCFRHSTVHACTVHHSPVAALEEVEDREHSGGEYIPDRRRQLGPTDVRKRGVPILLQRLGVA
jgi:hypothetical protein